MLCHVHYSPLCSQSVTPSLPRPQLGTADAEVNVFFVYKTTSIHGTSAYAMEAVLSLRIVVELNIP